ncbi:hypothetical protein ASPBRDRAFT_198193 [Aspergillus brasiliensis CBS 101740]|uniref:Uncharacterized protein n=1 Tax=Aspergillus brasiliensis (strain CBS 101740 / IMI 381727 / IBT 21946) TaxID=767769 RepID=A0A1L9UCZ1_ASPBC|nr:hypothetical protein ASPBRDRAFT_198193 [Aspergillus brasiliensis CBS 101740]
MPSSRPVVILFAVSWVAKLTILVLESTENLPALDSAIQAASDPKQLDEAWQEADKYHQNALLWTFALHYKWEIAEGILPRIAYTIFNLAQPFLVERVLNFMKEPEHPHPTMYAGGLLAAYAVVCIGLAVSYTVYQHKTYRLVSIIRGSLVTLIFNKTLPPIIERITVGLRHIHDFYANFIEVGLAFWLMARLLGLATIAAVVVIIACLIIGVPLAIASGDAQGTWLEAVEERIAVTSQALGVLKSIKMTGLTEVVSNNIRDLRSRDVKSSLRFRFYNVLILTFSYASSALAPVFGFGVYTVLAWAQNSGALTNSMAFSALTLFYLIDHPLMSIIDGSEDLMAVVNCFQRIQKFLLETERRDYRIIRSAASGVIDHETSEPHNDGEVPCVIAQDLSAAWSVDDEPVLRSLSFQINPGLITMLVGPVGCRKSTLLKLLLGEVAEVSGTISTNFATAAYCSQTPWITFGTVRQNIVGSCQWDQGWYDTVVQACSLKTDLQQLPAGDETRVGVRGSCLSGGQQMRVALARALYSRERVLVLDDVLTGLDRETERAVIEAVFSPGGLIKRSGLTVILATNSAHHLRFADYIISLNGDGNIIEQGTYDTLAAREGYVGTLTRSATPMVTSRSSELLLDDETLKNLNLDNNDDTDQYSRSSSDFSVFVYYFNVVGRPLLALFFVCVCAFTFGLTFPQIWLQWWTVANEKRPNEDIWYWLGVYGALGVLTLASAFFAIWVFGMLIIPKTAQRFHEILLGVTMNATTSVVTSTDIGTTTNRFSQDLELVDGELPEAFELTTYAILDFFVEGILVFVGSSYAAVAVLPLVMLVVYLVGTSYVRTSRQIRLLDIEAKAPLFSNFLEAMSGLPSIRAYGWSEDYKRRALATLEASQKPFYALYCIQRWLSVVLDLLLAGIAVVVVAIALSMVGNSNMAMLGISLFNIVCFSGTLQVLVTQWIDLETSIGAVSRIRSYVQQRETEDPAAGLEIMPNLWPEKGDIQISGVVASYSPSSEPVLRNINLNISAGEKVALCGRTGSGKSSLVSTILQLLHIHHGSILIDGIDISQVSSAALRSRVNTIPQQPFFLHGSIRLNANPEGNASEETIKWALQTVNLWSCIESRGGLDAEMTEDTLSRGQQQLFCLARALCKPSSILIIDEATSSVDADTDTLMQNVIRTHFQEQTIIAIAHKLESVQDFDKIAVMDSGQIVAYDTPKALLSKGKSVYGGLPARCA